MTSSGGTALDDDRLDVERARRETPGCRSVAHLNNAGAALPPSVVTTTVTDHLQREASIGGYEAAAEAVTQVEEVYRGIARLLRCDPDEIALAESATRAWDMAFYAFDLQPGDTIVTGTAEYSSNLLAFLQAGQRHGSRVEIVPDDETGQIDVASLATTLERLGPAAKLVALTHVPTSGGLVNPAAEVGRVARAAGVPYLLDACQSVGQLDLDVREIGCDLLSATGRKFLRAPRGTGFLYVSRRLLDRLDPPFVDLRAAEWVAEDRFELRGDARRFEGWEASVALRLGLGAAVDYALSWGLSSIEARVVALAARLRGQLAALPGVSVHDRGRRRCGIVTFSVTGRFAAEVVDLLRAGGVNTNVTPAATARLDLGRRGLDDLVRASVHYYNDESELDLLVDLLRPVIGGVSPTRAGQAQGMTEQRVNDDQPADPVQAPEQADSANDPSIPTGGNEAQAAAVFGVHNEPPAEMDSGGAG